MPTLLTARSHVPFTAIECDHDIQQKDCVLKVLGGIIGIANSDRGFEEYFLTAADYGNIIKDFCETFGIEDNQIRKTEDQFQLSDSKHTQSGGNVKKISSIFSTNNINFGSSDVVFNILTMKVLPEKEATCFLQVEIIGQEGYTSFVK